MAAWDRIVAHVDMDAFYASVEIRDDPSLAGLPIAVGGASDRRGVIAAASYAARAYGVRSAMPTAQALRLCPQLRLIRGDMAKYAAVSRALFRVLGEFSPVIEPLSLDEAYLDLAGTERLFGPPARTGECIRRRIREELSLPASVGVGSSKLVAKLASDGAKPDGLLVVSPDEAPAWVRALPLGRLPGVGPRTEAALAKLGIRTVAALAQSSESLARGLGDGAGRLIALANGIDDRRVVPPGAAKSLSRETTFASDLTDGETLAAVLFALAEDVARRARTAGVAGRTVTLKLRTSDFRTFTRQRTLPEPVDDVRPLADAAIELMGALRRPGAPVRLLGVGLSGLGDAVEIDLFGRAGREETLQRLHRTEDDVVRRFGRHSLSRARTLLSDPDTPGPASAREGHRR